MKRIILKLTENMVSNKLEGSPEIILIETSLSGPVVRTGPNELSFASPNAAKDILAVGRGVEKTNFYWVFPPAENPDIFTEIREWKHAQMKRFTVKAYSFASVKKMTLPIEDVERELIRKLDGFANNTHSVCDLGDWLHWFAFDVRLPIEADYFTSTFLTIYF